METIPVSDPKDQASGPSQQNAPGQQASGANPRRLRTVPRNPAPDDPRQFDPDKHDFPEDPEISDGLEKKLDILIYQKFRTKRLLGCLLIPIILGIWIIAFALIFIIVFGFPRPLKIVTPAIPITNTPVLPASTPIPANTIVPDIVQLTVEMPTLPPEQPIPTEQPPQANTPTCITFNDAQDDTYNRNNNQPYSDPQADILSMTLCGDVNGVKVIVQMGSPFPQGDYSHAINTVITSTLEQQPHNFLYQVHDGVPTIGEVNNNFQLIPGSPVTVTYKLDSGQKELFFPTSYIANFSPSITISSESFHMGTPSSVWSGDRTAEFGPVDLVELVPMTIDLNQPPAAASPLTLLAERPTFCRGEPDTNSGQKWTLEPGDIVPIVGFYENGWWLVKIDDPRTSTECCWVGAGVVQGDTSTVPLLSSLPAPGSCP